MVKAALCSGAIQSCPPMKGAAMMHNYVLLEDDTQIAYSEMREDRTVGIAIERPRDFGFDAAETSLPALTWANVDGFTDDELRRLSVFLKNNAPLIVRFAQEASKQYA